MIKTLKRILRKFTEKPDNEMKNGWVNVHTSNDTFHIQLLKSVLENNGVKAIILDKKDSFYKIGHTQLYVTENDLIRARTIISQHESQ
ncbi:MAG: putative signal transducing protein [Flavobacteriales bacterium]